MKKGQGPCFIFPFGSNHETRQVHEKDLLNNCFAAFFESRHHAYCLTHSRCSINIYRTNVLYRLCNRVLLMPVTEFTVCLEKVQLCILKHQKSLKGLNSKTVDFVYSITQQLMLLNSLRIKDAHAASEKLNRDTGKVTEEGFLTQVTFGGLELQSRAHQTGAMADSSLPRGFA